jgi:hypothetical protein
MKPHINGGSPPYVANVDPKDGDWIGGTASPVKESEAFDFDRDHDPTALFGKQRVFGQLGLLLAGVPKLERGPSEPASDNHQAVGKENERRVSGFRFAKEFDNPTMGFFGFIFGIACAVGLFGLGCYQLQKGRNNLGLVILALGVATMAAACVGFALISIIPEV